MAASCRPSALDACCLHRELQGHQHAVEFIQSLRGHREVVVQLLDVDELLDLVELGRQVVTLALQHVASLGELHSVVRIAVEQLLCSVEMASGEGAVRLDLLSLSSALAVLALTIVQRESGTLHTERQRLGGSARPTERWFPDVRAQNVTFTFLLHLAA